MPLRNNKSLFGDFIWHPFEHQRKQKKQNKHKMEGMGCFGPHKFKPETLDVAEVQGR